MSTTVVELTADHKYVHASGREVMSVSAILRAADIRPAPFTSGRHRYVIERALQRGRDVHRLTRAIDEAGDEQDALDDRFDPADVTEESVNYVAAYNRFLKLSGYQPIAWEKVLYHPVYDYAGRTDMVGWLGNLRVLGDRKTDKQLHRAVWLQLAAYREAWNVQYPHEPIDQTGALVLKSDTTFEWKPNPLEPGDFPFFVGCIWVARWKKMAI